MHGPAERERHFPAPPQLRQDRGTNSPQASSLLFDSHTNTQTFNPREHSFKAQVTRLRPRGHNPLFGCLAGTVDLLISAIMNGHASPEPLAMSSHGKRKSSGIDLDESPSQAANHRTKRNRYIAIAWYGQGLIVALKSQTREK